MKKVILTLLLGSIFAFANAQDKYINASNGYFYFDLRLDPVDSRLPQLRFISDIFYCQDRDYQTRKEWNQRFLTYVSKQPEYKKIASQYYNIFKQVENLMSSDTRKGCNENINQLYSLSDSKVIRINFSINDCRVKQEKKSYEFNNQKKKSNELKQKKNIIIKKNTSLNSTSVDNSKSKTKLTPKIVSTHPSFNNCSGSFEDVKICFEKTIRKNFNENFDTSILESFEQYEDGFKINVSFKATKTGIIEIKNINSSNQKIISEVTRVFNKLPKLIPATQRLVPSTHNARNVSVPFSISFILNIENKKTIENYGEKKYYIITHFFESYDTRESDKIRLNRYEIFAFCTLNEAFKIKNNTRDYVRKIVENTFEKKSTVGKKYGGRRYLITKNFYNFNGDNRYSYHNRIFEKKYKFLNIDEITKETYYNNSFEKLKKTGYPYNDCLNKITNNIFYCVNGFYQQDYEFYDFGFNTYKSR